MLITIGVFFLALNVVCGVYNAATGSGWLALFNGFMGGALLVALLD